MVMQYGMLYATLYSIQYLSTIDSSRLWGRVRSTAPAQLSRAAWWAGRVVIEEAGAFRGPACSLRSVWWASGRAWVCWLVLVPGVRSRGGGE